MKILGISPLDKDSTVCLLEDGKILSAIAEERLSRVKMHEGFPYLALKEIMTRYNLTAEDIDAVVYSFFDWEKEGELTEKAIAAHIAKEEEYNANLVFEKMSRLPVRNGKTFAIPGLAEEKLYMHKPLYMEIAYKILATSKFLGSRFARKKLLTAPGIVRWCHKKSARELDEGLREFGLAKKLVRVDHHTTHAVNAFYTSGFSDALIVTLDGYGSGLAGSISIGNSQGIKRIHDLPYPVSLGEFYEKATSSLGFRAGRHEGKIVGLAAYDDPDILYDIVRSYFEVKNGSIYYRHPYHFVFTRYLASQYAKPTVAASYQKVLERIACEYVEYYVRQTGLKNVVLSGGVVANVKANQRIFEIDGVENIFIHPNMGDGGCSVGGALYHYNEKTNGGLVPSRLENVYLGPEYTDDEILAALRKAGLEAERPEYVEKRIAELLVDGNIVARFNGRMEYGPRALGNRSILYHAKDPSVNLWLNQQLKRTEFMPFAPATLYEEREKCYKNICGAEYASQFMTITFDCTDFMVKKCPAAVHVDATARPQLVSETSNESFYKIIKEYYKLTGIPSVINTSFNMHEEPIVCTPEDAIKSFLQGHIPYLAIGPYIVKSS